MVMDTKTTLVIGGGIAFTGALLGSPVMMGMGSALAATVLLEGTPRFEPTYEDLSCGTLVVGHPGNGKTYLILHMICSDWMPREFGGVWMSPKGADELLGRLPGDTADRVVLVQPHGRHPQGINPLETFCDGDIHDRREEWHVVAQDVTTWFVSDVNPRAGWKQSALLEAGTRALLEWGFHHKEQVSAIDLVRLFRHEGFRQDVLRSASPIDEGAFAVIDKQALDRTAIMVQSKFASPTVAALLGQPKGINLREIINSGRWLILDTPKERVPDAPFVCRTVAGMIERATVHKKKLRHGGKPFMVVCDEIQEYPTKAFASGIYTAREYGVGWVLLHQTRNGQLAAHPGLKAATEVCQTKYIFGVTPDDAAEVALLSGGRWEADTFINLEKRHYRAIRRVNGGRFMYEDDGRTPELRSWDHAGRDGILKASLQGPTREEILSGITVKLRGGGREDVDVCM